MRKKAFQTLLLLCLSASVLAGCGTTTAKEDKQANTESSTTKSNTTQTKSQGLTLSTIEEDVYYIYHKDKSLEPVYIGESTFDSSSIADNPSSGRIAWFKGDFDKIPTMYPGDTLVYYTTKELGEKFTFERFEDLGYTLGLCNMSATPSGRYRMSTDPDNISTYPGGDTDALLLLENENVVIDKIAGNDARISTEDDPYSLLSRCGTIIGLNKDQKYDVDVYAGTIHHPYVFTADIRALGSMEVTQTSDFLFDDGNIITIGIPTFFNDGYYMINGGGFFRMYSGETYVDENVNKDDMNLPNENPDDDDSVSTTSITAIDTTQEDIENEILEQDLSINDQVLNSFEVTEAGEITVNISFTLNSNAEMGDGLPDVTGIITSPSGKTQRLLETEDGGLMLSFNANEVGEYVITYYNLDIRSPHLSITTD